jgi:hypothetical protein
VYSHDRVEAKAWVGVAEERSREGDDGKRPQMGRGGKACLQ